MAVPAQPATVLGFEQARACVLDYCRNVTAHEARSVALADALGRVLAEPVLADRDFPPFPRATRDGFALRAADLKSIPATLQVIGQIQAGASFDGHVDSGQSVEIMT